MKTKIYQAILILFIYSATSLPQGSGLNIGANYILYPSNVNQSEVFITKHPTNENILFASANTIVFQPFFISEGIYVSTDGGNSWYGSDTCNGANIAFHQGDPGISIDNFGRFILSRLGRQPFYGIYSHYSNDNGINWSAQNKITSDGESLYERASLATDNNPLSNFYGRTYATWVKLSGTFPVELSTTDDITQPWRPVKTINSFTQRSAGPDIEVGNDGEVFICYALVSSVSPFREIAISFAKSLDGGNTWDVRNNVFPVNGINGVLSQKSNIRVNGLPRLAVDKSNAASRGNIYIVTTQINLTPAGSDPDIIFYRSTDNGETWSQGIRVNQDQLNNGKTQYFPAIEVDEFGGINIIYYDDRLTTNDSASVFLSRSTDQGETWTDYKISDHNFKPLPIGGLGQGYQGDNIDITSINNKLFPVWMDNLTGIYQIWSTIITFDPINVEEKKFIPSEFTLNQNFPNPFNPRTKIRFSIPFITESSTQNSQTTLKIFDILGNEVSTLINDYLTPGEYEVEFDGSVLPSGVYYYQLKYGSLSAVKKMILLK